tara:strand:+ start:317 stop:889 length:573 start_codon:yes stop_codon:yes gene_type:complete
MNNFYSANGSINNYKIIEHFDSPNEGVSIISHLIESEKQKNKVIELEKKIDKLDAKLSEFNLLITEKVNEVKKYLPFNNDDFSSIISKKSNDWNIEDDNIFIEIVFEKSYEYIPNIYTELILNKDYTLSFKKRIANLSKDSFRIYLKLINFSLEDYNSKNDTNYIDVIEMLKADLTLNYIVIGQTGVIFK